MKEPDADTSECVEPPNTGGKTVGAEVESAAHLDEEGRLRPGFLRGFPAHPELDRLVAAFECGDYATVRRDAPRLSQHSKNSKVRAAAEELFRRIQPDPSAVRLLWIALALLAFLIFWTYGIHGH